MQVGEEHLPLAHPVVLLGDRLLDLEHQFRDVPDLVGALQDLGAGGGELLIGDARSEPGAGLDEDLVTATGELVDAGGRDRHPVLVVLDLAWDADLHDADTSLRGTFTPTARRHDGPIAAPVNRSRRRQSRRDSRSPEPAL
ncbi:hypothetical protein GCM10029963_18230 [Micromonospora andamanensis]